MRHQKRHDSIPLEHIVREYDEAEAQAWARLWLRVYARNRQGANIKAYLWHIFSFQRYPSLSGAAAEGEYLKQTGAEFVVLSNDCTQALLTDQLPKVRPWSDCYVFPPNLAWTMALTHEDGWLGPYFARHRDHVSLDLENEKRLRKAHEKEVARRKGWST
jgi:hypothetical protein